MKLIYNLWYRFGKPPWVLGPREELVRLVESGRLQPCRAIDLGCGTGDNAIFLAQRDFDVTGVDYAPSAIAKAKQKAEEAGVTVAFHVDDLTRLRGDYGTFDLLVDYSTLDDLRPAAREQYVRSVLPLARPGALFLLYCFEWHERWWERLLGSVFRASIALNPGEAQERFSAEFEMECIARDSRPSGMELGYAVYLMARRETPVVSGGGPA